MLPMYTIVVLDARGMLVGFHFPGDIGSNTTTGILTSKERCEDILRRCGTWPVGWTVEIRQLVFA